MHIQVEGIGNEALEQSRIRSDLHGFPTATGNYIIKGSLAEKLPIYEQHRRVIESLRNSRLSYNRCVIAVAA